MKTCIHEGCGARLRTGAGWCHRCARSQTWQARQLGTKRRAATPGYSTGGALAFERHVARIRHQQDVDGRKAKTAWECLRDEPDDLEIKGKGCTRWESAVVTEKNVIS